MAFKTNRLQPVSVQFRLAKINTYEELHGLIVSTAKTENAKVLSTDPRPSSFTRYVDGVKGAPEEAVRSNGVILYEYHRIDLVVQMAMETLFDKSPVLSGKYREAHTIYLNGVAVPNLKEWKSGDDVFISNPLPYTRKIEAGKMKMKVPGTDHVYAQAAQIVNRRYGNIARASLTYLTIPGAASENERSPALSITEL